jgi:DNA helicase-2/ATP-dependent DNA helicase PcrA
LTRIQLSLKQRQIVEHEGGALLVEAGPGSGKTRVLTERIRRLLSTPQSHFRVLGLTFTNKAANEMEERLEDLGEVSDRLFLGTLHSFCLRVLEDRGKRVGVTAPIIIFEKFEDRRSILLEAAAQDPSLRFHLESDDPKETNRRLGQWLNTIGFYKSNPSQIGQWKSALDPNLLEAYDGGLRASHAYDFDDILLLCYQLFTQFPKVAGFYRRLYQHICIDEAQDLNEAQYSVIRALCGGELSNVLMVGDDKQSIYGFSNAGPKYMRRFASEFSAEIITLDENYRSAAVIVDLARKLSPDYKVSGQLPIRGEMAVVSRDDPAGEAKAVADSIEYLLANGHPDVEGPVTHERCAVMGRTRYALLEVQRAFEDREVPFYKRISSLHVNESDLVEDFILGLRVFVNRQDTLHLGQLVQRWSGQGTAPDTPEDLTAFLRSVCRNDSQAAIVTGLTTLGEQERPDLAAVVTQFRAFASELDDEDDQKVAIGRDTDVLEAEWDYYVRKSPGGSATLSGFLASMALGTTHQCHQDGVALLTVHSAKGLEFDVVFVVGLNEGVLPDYRAKTTEALDEERRNLFVAVTRSRRLLFLCYPLAREMPWGDVKAQRPSRFLTDLGLVQ